ncbi:MAG: molecular chaperone TorD family protein [Thermoanaerobaculia bacterium]
MEKAEGRGHWAEVLRVAELLRYPDPPPRSCSDDGPEIRAFFGETAAADADGMEELYTRTFDLNPVATLEVGWHLWGEQYERGRFLANLRGAQEVLGIEAGTELPDHLTVLLPMLAKMPASNRDQLVREKLLPALEKIEKPLEESGNPYRHLIKAARAALSTGDEA